MFVKKITLVALTVLMVGTLVFTACSDDSSKTASSSGNSDIDSQSDIQSNAKNENNSNEVTDNQGSATDAFVPGSSISFNVSGVDVYVNMPTALFLDKISEVPDYFESESCAFQGLDKVYTYKNYVIRTYPVGDKDLVSSIEFTTDIVTTKEGCYIGMTKDEVKSLCSDLSVAVDSDLSLTYEDGDCNLSFILSEGVVVSITYVAI